MTLADIVSSVRGLLDDDQYDEALIKQAANWFVFELFNDTRTRLMETSDFSSALAGATTADYPGDLQTIIGIYVTTPRVYKLDRPMEYESFMRSFSNFASVATQQASSWTPFGNQMRFSAPLQGAHTFQIDYLRTPEPMEEDGDECEVPDNYSELVSLGTLRRIMKINEDYQESQQEKNDLDALVTTFKRNEGRGGGKVGPASIMRTNRSRVGSGNPFETGLRG